MATSSTSTFDLTRDVLIRRAYQVAGLYEASHEPSGDDISLASDIMQMELMSLQARGVVVTWVARTLHAIVADTAAYSLDTDTLDVAVDPNNVAGTFVPTSGAETPITVMSRSEYIILSSKTTSGTPSKVFIDRLSTVTLTFWPVPSDSGSFRYGKIRFPRDMDTGARTLDLSRRWQKAMVYSIGYQLALAKSMPLDRVGFLKNEAENLSREAMRSDVEGGHAQLFVPRFS